MAFLCLSLFQAHDVSCFREPLVGRRREEQRDLATLSGQLAGENMAGGQRRFEHQSLFWYGN